MRVQSVKAIESSSNRSLPVQGGQPQPRVTRRKLTRKTITAISRQQKDKQQENNHTVDKKGFSMCYALRYIHLIYLHSLPQRASMPKAASAQELTDRALLLLLSLSLLSISTISHLMPTPSPQLSSPSRVALSRRAAPFIDYQIRLFIQHLCSEFPNQHVFFMRLDRFV